MTAEEIYAIRGYQGCRNCKYQPEPLQTCDYGKYKTTIELYCRKWEKREEV